MKVIEETADFVIPAYSVVTIGTFDGVHQGHQAILERIVSVANRKNGKSILITFWPHPRFVLNKDPNKLKLLTTFEEKCDLIANIGVDYLLKIPFTPEFSNLSARAFVEKILVERVGTKELFIGYDHHFGNNREGNLDFLLRVCDEYGFSVNEISKQEIDHVGVSSTKIREALLKGQVDLANALLGRSYSIQGTIIHGDKKGRKINFPTANIEVDEDYKLLPSDGVYAVRAKHNSDLYDGMLNIGFKPTVGGNKRTVEVHLFNFEGNIYGEKLEIDFVAALRKEMKFEGLSELKEQLEKDKIVAIRALAETS